MNALPRAALVGVSASAAIFIAASIWFVAGVLAPVLNLFFGGWLLACALEPCVAALMRVARARRPTAVLATYALVLVVIAIGWSLIAPAIARQVDASITSLPAGVDAVARQLTFVETHANRWLADHGVAGQLDIQSGLRAQQLGLQLDSTAARAVAVASGALGALGNFAVMLLLSVFFLIDGPSLAEQIAHAFGSRFASDVRFVQTALHDAFDGFLRAQLLQGILYAGGAWACLALAQVDAAPLVGVASGVLLLVPLVGAVLAVVLPVVATLVWNPGAAIVVGLSLVLLEQLVLNAVGPRLMSRQSGLPPLLLLFGVFAGGQLAGLWGAVFGIPALVAVLTCAGYFRKRWSQCAAN